jgi:hypothetical protein
MADGAVNQWQILQPDPIPSLGEATALITSSLQALRNSLEALKLATQILSVNAEVPDTAIATLNNILRGTLAQVNGLITNALTTSGLYVLPIPLPKKGLARLLNIRPQVAPQNPNVNNVPLENIYTRAKAANAAVLRASYTLQQIFDPNVLLLGGNAYFLKTLSESLFDRGDPMRPTFSQNSAWLYSIFIAGASDVTAILNMGAYLDRLLGLGTTANSSSTVRGLNNFVPSNVQVRPSEQGEFAVVQWNHIPSSTLLDSYDNSSLVAKRWAVIRATDPRIRTARLVSDVFNTRVLTQGLRGNYGAQVLYDQDYDGIITRFVDNTALEPGVTYYYAVAFAADIEPVWSPQSNVHRYIPNVAQGTVGTYYIQPPATQALNFNRLSDWIEYQRPSRREDFQRNGISQAPDWIRTPSVGMIPAVTRVIDRIQEALNQASSVSENATERANRYVEFLQREIDRLGTRIDGLNSGVAELQSVFNVPNAGIAWTVRTGTGDVGDFLTSVVSAFENQEDPGRPPFDNGDEFVVGVVILGVVPDVTALAALSTLFTQLFGNGETDPTFAGIQSVQTQLTQIENQLLVELGESPEFITENQSLTFNEDMTPRAPGEGDSSCG